MLVSAGDCFRYASEAGDEHSSEIARDEYGLALALSTQVLPPAHPTRLGAALNLCVLLEEDLKV